MSVRKILLSVLASGLIAAPQIADAKKSPTLFISVPIIIEPATSSGALETVGQQQIFGAQPAQYRSAITIVNQVEVPVKKGSIIISPGEMLLEAIADDRRHVGKLYCRVTRTTPKTVLTICLGDADGDGRLETLFTGAGGLLAPILPYPIVRTLAVIDPVQPVLVDDASKLQARMGFYVSGNNPLLGEHHFYPVFAQGDGLYTIIGQHNGVGVKTLPTLVRFNDAEVRLTAYADKKYSVSVTKPLPAGTIQLSLALPKRTIYVYVPGLR